MTIRVLSTPADFINKAITPVFMQKIQEERNKVGSVFKIIKKLSVQLLLVAALPVFVLLIFAPGLFAVTLGKNWMVSGEYAQIMIIAFFMSFVQNATGTIIELYERLYFRLFDQIFFFILSLLSFGLGGWLGDIWICLGLFSTLSCIRYLVLIYYTFKIVNKL